MILLLLLSLAYYPALVLHGLILADYDVFVYFYPLRQYAANALAEGRLPQWNPGLFLGSPFLANPQTSLFYPLGGLFYLLPIPTAYSASLVLHVFLAGAGFYVFARRSLALGTLGSLVGSTAFMFSGFFAGQAGHLNQLSAAAWLPLMLLCFDEAIRRGNVRMLAAAAVVVGIQFLAGHPQESYISLVVLGLFQGSRVLGEAPRRLAWAAAALGIGAGLGAGLAAVQLLPSLLWSRESVRAGGLEFTEAAFASVPPWEVPWAFLPDFSWHPLASSEWLGFVGVAPLVAAALALTMVRRAVVLAAALVAALGLTLSLGAALPVYQWFFDYLPLFDRFRVPARWLFSFCFGAATLAALGVDWASGRVRPKVNGVLGERLGRIALVAALLGAMCYWAIQFATPVPRRLIAVWLFLAVGAGLALSLLRRCPAWRSLVSTILLAVCVAELFAAPHGLPYRFAVPADVYAMPREPVVHLLALPPIRVLSVTTESFEPHDGAAFRERLSWLPPRSLMNYLHAVKLNENLAPNIPLVYGLATADGYDGGLLPSRRYVEFSRLFIPEHRVRNDGVWQSRLEHVPEPRLLDLIGVAAVITSTIRDAVVDGVPYDRAVTIVLEPGEAHTITRLPDVALSTLGMLSAFEGSRPGDGEEVGRIEVRGAGGQVNVFPLRFAAETAGRHELPNAASSLLRPVEQAESPPRWDYEARFSLNLADVATITVRNTAREGRLYLTAITLINTSTGLIEPIVLEDRLERTVFHDSKLYRLRDALPRAYLVTRAEVLDDGQALLRLADEQFDPRTAVILAPHPEARPMAGRALSVPTLVDRVSPEHLRIQVDAPASGYVVVTEAIADGWRAWVDGQAAPLLRANYLFQAVPVEEGQHVIDLRYETPGLTLGLQVSALSLAIIVLLVVAGRWRRLA